MGIISIIGMWELYKVFNVHKKIAGIFGYIFCALYYANLQFGFLRETYLLFVIFLLALEKKKTKIIVSSFLSIILSFILLYNRAYFNPYQKVTFLNVYQGDCCIILDSNSDKVMLIDTGGLSNYDIASKKIMPYLNYHGIRKIDIVVITHEDYDHCGALESLSKQIQIDQVIKDPSVKEVTLGKITLTNIKIYHKLFK